MNASSSMRAGLRGIERASRLPATRSGSGSGSVPCPGSSIPGRRSIHYTTRSPVSSPSAGPSSLISTGGRRSTTASGLTSGLARSRSRSFFSLPDITKLAGLIPGQSQSAQGRDSSEPTPSIRVDGEEQHFHARKILPYSQAQLYALVSDVPSYSSFIPFCNSSTVLAPAPDSKTTTAGERGTGTASGSASGKASRQRRREWKDWTPGTEPFSVHAELAVGFGGLEERYISKVVGKPFDSVTATASNQTPLFKSLISTWSFSPASAYSPHPTDPSSPSSSSSSSSSSSPASTSSTASTASSTDPSSSPREPNSTAAPDPHQGPTLLTIDLAFNFANPLHRIASQAVLPKVADKMVEAFEKRCLEVWGKGTE